MQSQPPKISVVCSAYNAQDFVDATIASVLAQTRADFELIIVDDGSTDETLKIASAWAGRDSRIFVLTQKNGGYGCGRNLGIKKARGEWIAIIDADDLWHPQFLEQMERAFFRASKECVGVFCGSQDIGPEGQDLKIQRTPKARAYGLFETVMTENPGRSGSCFLFKSALIRKVGGYDEQNLRVGMDAEILYRLIYSIPGGHLLGLPKILVSYRRHPGSISSNIGIKRIEQFKYFAQTLKPHLSGGNWAQVCRKYLNRCMDTSLDRCDAEVAEWAQVVMQTQRLKQILSGRGYRTWLIAKRAVIQR